MPPRYRILLAKQVATDLQDIFDYIAPRSPQNARRVIKRILDAIDGLEIFPHRTVVADQRARSTQPIRSLPVQSWIVFFRVDDHHEIVRVLRVRHGSRQRPGGMDQP